jgi:4-amino-4-deoxy-L-arabinose transferase-like glycosyltransferase
MPPLTSWLSLLPPATAWLGLFRLTREPADRQAIQPDGRIGFVLTSAAWGAILAVITEAASLFRMLNASGLIALWLGANAAIWGTVLGLRRSSPGTRDGRRPSLAEPGPGSKLRDRFRQDALGATIILLFSALLAITAWLTPTTNWDSLTYHLPRVLHWIQQQSLDHYPTGIERQLEMGPWSAFVQTNFLLLYGSDRFANLVQWYAMMGSLIALTSIVRRLSPETGADRGRTELFAALLLITLPTGLVQSITPQTDYVTTFWLASFLALLLELYSGAESLWPCAGIGLALGLGLLTKATFILYAAPGALALAVLLIVRSRGPKLAARVGLMAGLIALLNVPHGLRNNRLYGSPLGSPELREATVVGQFTVGRMVSNLIRNASLHTGTGIKPLTVGLNRTLNWLHGFTGRPLDDRDTSFGDWSFKFYDEFLVYDSFAGDPYHLALVAVAAAIWLARRRKFSLPAAYAAGALASLLLICLMLRWQRWNCRLHLPCLALLMPLVAITLGPRLRNLPRHLVALGLAAFALVIILNNRSRPIFNPAFWRLPRPFQMLIVHSPQMPDPMARATREVMKSGCRNVGLRFGPDDPEYPWWVLLRSRGFTGRIDHVLVDGPSGRIPFQAEPDVIISAIPGPLPEPLAKSYPGSTVIDPWTLHWSAGAMQRRSSLPSAARE